MAFGHDLLVHNELLHPVGGIRLLGKIAAPSALPARRLRTIDNYAIVLVRSNAGKYRDANGTRCDVKRGDVIVLFPGLAHTYFPLKGETWDEIYCVFEGGLFDAFFKTTVFSPKRPVIAGAPNTEDRLMAIVNAADAAEQNGLLVALLMELSTTQSTMTGHGWVEQAKEILAADTTGSLSLMEVAERLGMSEQTFRKRFAAVVGVPPAKYRMQCRLESAKRLLEQTSLTNRRISESLGFSDEFHFSKAFTNHAGTSPSAYRRQHISRLN